MNSCVTTVFLCICGLLWLGATDSLAAEPANPQPAVTIDAGKTAEPISKYIYGQFIEHLGRCIYGGIWAEMLEDRKFFYPVGANDSPWKTLGTADTVTMIKQNQLVGEHTPEVRLSGDSPCGIVQGGLGLLKGREYVGRIVVAVDDDVESVQVSLIWGPGAGDRQSATFDHLSADYKKWPLRFTAGADTDDGRLEIAGRGRGRFRIGAVSLMPADNVHGMRADTLKLLKELDAPIYRWPGGNFVSGYNWKDGLGDPDRRPPRKNPAWKGVEHNDFGMDEFIVFCRELKTEPLIVVNTGLGQVEMAIEELEYANGGPETPMGRLRAKNGRAEPYKVTWWGIGNEMYGNWQLGHMPLEKYTQKHNQFVDAMRKVDPSIKCIAVGAVGPWSERMLKECAGHMELMSEHFYCGDKPDVVDHIRQIPNNIRRIANAHRDYRKKIDALKGKDIRIAMDEWNYWYGPDLYGEIGVQYHLKDALGIAAGINEYSRCTDIIFMANYAQTVNVIGAIKTSKTEAVFDTTGLVLKVYRHQFGSTPVAVDGNVEPLDVAAAWTQDRKVLTVSIVNPTVKDIDLSMDLKGAALTGEGRLYRIAGLDPMAANKPGRPPAVVVREEPCTGLKNRLTLPPLSASLYALSVR